MNTKRPAVDICKRLPIDYLTDEAWLGKVRHQLISMGRDLHSLLEHRGGFGWCRMPRCQQVHEIIAPPKEAR